MSNQQLFAATAVCLGSASKLAYHENRYVVDLQTGTTLYAKNISTGELCNGTNDSSCGLSMFSFVTDVAVLSVTQRVTVVADSVTIRSPDEGEKLRAGTHTIVGTSPPNTALHVTIDAGIAVGTVQADQYGAWQLEHEFSIAKTYNIKAEYSKATKQVQYLAFIGYDTSQYPDVIFGGKIVTFNTY